MLKLEVFFDYACPYCLRGHEYLLELLPQYPQVEIVWCPCEAHPRPDRYGLHSDLCARGMYFALDLGADILEYHDRMYCAAVKNRADIEDLRIVSELTDSLLDSDAFYAALSGGAYLNRLLENNRFAWETYCFPAVPSYRMNGKLLKSIENIGVSIQRLADFIEQNIWEELENE